MSEVTKKSDTSSSQMRLLGGAPHMYQQVNLSDKVILYIKMEWSERGNDKLGALETKWSREIACPFDYQSENLSEIIKHPHVVFSYSTKIFPQFVVCMSVAHYL